MALFISAIFFTLVVESKNAFGGNTDQLKIVKPTEGLRVSPGQNVSIVIQPANNVNLKEMMVVSLGEILQITGPPWESSFHVPPTANGTLSLTVVGKDHNGKIYDSEVRLTVIQNSSLLRLESETDRLYFEHLDPDIFMYITVKGVYRDGIRRDLNKLDSGTVFTSSDPDIAVVKPDGRVIPKSNGKTKITVRNGEAMMSVPVEVLTSIDSEINQISTQNSVPRNGILSSIVNVHNKDAQRAIDLRVVIEFPINLALLEAKGEGWSCSNVSKNHLECQRGNLNGGLRSAIYLKYKSESLCKNIEIVASLQAENQEENVDDNLSVLRLPCSR
ncbi:MAG: hypothetical protein IPL83_18065 [Bdellovibrionales bacterium]|nr:hypothetical protein [Bdellovibrionales bacterium]